jgi:predicted DNA-binding transcriptional regulator YafY
MRRTDRLFELLQLFRGGRLRRGEDLAASLGVSLRTVYRDIDTLLASGVPIEAERGVGFIMRQPVFLPPLTFTLLELEALNLGMRLAIAASDAETGTAARSVLGKIDAVLPDNLPRSDAPWTFAVYKQDREKALSALPTLRAAIKGRIKTNIRYVALDQQATERCIWPLQIEFWGHVWTCSAWCEERRDFRVFRVDRMLVCETGAERFPIEPDKSLKAYFARLPACKFNKQGL